MNIYKHAYKHTNKASFKKLKSTKHRVRFHPLRKRSILSIRPCSLYTYSLLHFLRRCQKPQNHHVLSVQFLCISYTRNIAILKVKCFFDTQLSVPLKQRENQRDRKRQTTEGVQIGVKGSRLMVDCKYTLFPRQSASVSLLMAILCSASTDGTQSWMTMAITDSPYRISP